MAAFALSLALNLNKTKTNTPSKAVRNKWVQAGYSVRNLPPAPQPSALGRVLPPHHSRWDAIVNVESDSDLKATKEHNEDVFIFL